MTPTPEIPRWQYRFENFSRAYQQLSSAVTLGQQRELNDLEKEGLIQRFEYTLELAWKVMKDYLEAQGVLLEQVTPRAVLRSAFEAKLIQEGQVWQNALDTRNALSHTYSMATFEKAIHVIVNEYHPAMNALHTTLMQLLKP